MSPNSVRRSKIAASSSLSCPSTPIFRSAGSTPFPGGGELPKRYSHTHDPFVALSFAAAATKKLKIGTGICLVPQHEPIVTAKAIASLDRCRTAASCSASAAAGMSTRWRTTAPPTRTRFKIMREHVLAMKALWTEEEASYHGEFVNFDPVWSYPKPAQRPHPPILLGGESDHTLAASSRICDGWFPRTLRRFDPAGGRRLKAAAERAAISRSLSITVFGAPNKAEALESYAKAGIDGALLAVPDGTRDEILAFLDKQAPLTKVAA
jgi:alkanesulfonate monooxygenase SsuD/methylene tetrahydromethanopterin reductase-like flavin-dependent oxidoreductase (luciferase family)